MLLAVAVSIEGCAIVPAPAEVDAVDTELDVASLALSPGQSVAVLGRTAEDEEDARCARDVLADGLEGVSLLDEDAARAVLGERFEPVRGALSEAQVMDVLDEPAVADTVRRAGLRYVIQVSMTTRTSDVEGPAVPHLLGGVGSLDRSSHAYAHLYEMDTGSNVGDVHVTASGDGGFVGYGFYGLWAVPVTESVSCRALGRTLVTLFTREPP